MTIEVERIEIVTPIQGRTGCVMAQRVITIDGETRSLSPINLYVGDLSSVEQLPVAVTQAISAINAQLQAQVDQLTTDLASANAAKQQAESSLASITAERDQLLADKASLQSELDALKNPPNPFPDADWKSFRFAILADPAINRVAEVNATAWPLMVLYLSQLDTMPSRGPDIAQLWNFMEAHSAVTAEEIARINAIAEQFKIPLRLNSEGQIAQ